MLATLLASTPLLEESWKLCGQANAEAPQSYGTKQMGHVTYIAFSGIQMLAGLDPSCSNLVPIESSANGLFSSLHRHGEGKEPVMVHAGLLHLFLSFYSSPIFHNQVCNGLRIQIQFILVLKRRRLGWEETHTWGWGIASLVRWSYGCRRNRTNRLKVWIERNTSVRSEPSI